MNPQKDRPLTDELISIRDWLRYGVSLFHRHGLSGGQGFLTGSDEILFLIRKTLHLPLEDMEHFMEARVTSAERSELESVFRRRLELREPTAYIAGCMEYGPLELEVNRSVLIPRSYFVEVIPEQIEPFIEDPDGPMQVLDLCCGSGCIGILAAVHYPEAFVDLVDVSADALELADRNVARYQLEDRVRTIQSDLFEGLGSERYDLILCNPPYEPDAVLDRLPPEFGFEPPSALVSGEDGMLLIQRILNEVGRYLAEGGCLVLEVGGLRPLIEERFPHLNWQWLETTDADGDIGVLFAEDFGED
jgi:ribosomal protein L3 glutamine methyltransferase